MLYAMCLLIVLGLTAPVVVSASSTPKHIGPNLFALAVVSSTIMAVVVCTMNALGVIK